MQISLATATDKEDWDNYVLNHPEGTAYQLFAWQEAVERAYHFKGIYLLAKKKLSVCGILPLIDFHLPLIGRTLISLPYCDTGGTLSDDADVARELLARARSLASQYSSKYSIRAIRSLSDANTNQTDKVRMMLDLPSSLSVLQDRLNAKVRSQAKKPIRDGLIVKVGSDELIKDFYSVFAENMRDLGSPVHSCLWIESIVSFYGDRARVGVVYTPEGFPSAAGIVLVHPSTMSIPWASSLRRHKSNNSNMLLYWTFLSLSIEMGCRFFDFGRSSPGEGTYRFKAQWGATPEPLFWDSYPLTKKLSSGQGRTGTGLRSLAESLWRHMPLSACNALGPKFRRCIHL